jgi:hypothetical protein
MFMSCPSWCLHHDTDHPSYPDAHVSDVVAVVEHDATVSQLRLMLIGGNDQQTAVALVSIDHDLTLTTSEARRLAAALVAAADALQRG